MFFISIGACIPLINNSTNSTELIATIVYSIGIFLMFGFSALYHRVNWRPEVLKIMRRLDHSSIFIMIAGSFTPICLLVLPEKPWIATPYNHVGGSRHWYTSNIYIYKCISHDKSWDLSYCGIYSYTISFSSILPYGFC